VKSFNILRQKTFWNSKADFVVRKMVFSQKKSISYEMFQHFVTKNHFAIPKRILLVKNGFFTRKIDLL